MALLVTIIDQNSFDRVLLRKAFTDHAIARRWAQCQKDQIIHDMASVGEDLLDIKAEFDVVDIDDEEVVHGLQWRSN